MKKRAQITIFIIVGILIVAAAVLIFIFKKEISSFLFVNSDEEEIILFVNSFIEESLRNEIKFLASQGGYYDVPSGGGIVFFNQEIPFYFLNGKTALPSKKVLEEQISEAVYEDILHRMNFSSLEEKGFYIQMENFRIISEISGEKIRIVFNPELYVRKADTDYSFDEFVAEEKSNFFNLYSASLILTEDYSENSGFVCLTCIDSVSEQTGFEISAYPVDDPLGMNDIIWFVLKDNSEENLTWRFVVEK